MSSVEVTQTNCAACSRTIDASAKLCPYCGANPVTGERLDTEALLQEVFRPKEMSTSDSVFEYARQRQGVFIAVSAFVAFLIIAGLHQFVTTRNANVVTDSPAVPLSEITDVTKKADETAPVPMPDMDFMFNGTPRRMRTYVVENGATTPPEVLAEQQAAQQAQAAAQAQKTPQQPGVVPPGARPAVPGPAVPAPAVPRPQPRPTR
jgi:hypothetical protein